MEMKPEVKNYINPNDPACHNGGDTEYKKMGFMNKEDYECHMRRMSDRKKAAKDMASGSY